jgi:hypothetical protein
VSSGDKMQDQSEGGDPILGNITMDHLDKVVNAKLTPNGDIHYELSWNPRYDGTTPGNSYYSSDVVRQHYPQRVIDFIEERLRQKLLKNKNKP